MVYMAVVVLYIVVCLDFNPQNVYTKIVKI